MSDDGWRWGPLSDWKSRRGRKRRSKQANGANSHGLKNKTRNDRRVRKKSSTIRVRTHAFTHSAQCLIADILAKRAEGTHGGLAVWSSGREESADSILTHSPLLPHTTNISLRISFVLFFSLSFHLPLSLHGSSSLTSLLLPFPRLFHVPVLVFLLLVFFHDHHERLLPVPEWAAIFRKLSPSPLLPLAHSRFSSRSLARARLLPGRITYNYLKTRLHGAWERLSTLVMPSQSRVHIGPLETSSKTRRRGDADAPGPEGSEGRQAALPYRFLLRRNRCSASRLPGRLQDPRCSHRLHIFGALTTDR